MLRGEIINRACWKLSCLLGEVEPARSERGFVIKASEMERDALPLESFPRVLEP